MPPGLAPGEISDCGRSDRSSQRNRRKTQAARLCGFQSEKTGAGLPDMGLFGGAGVIALDDWPKARPPERGVVEVDDLRPGESSDGDAAARWAESAYSVGRLAELVS